MDESVTELLEGCRREHAPSIERLVVRFRPWALSLAVAAVGEEELAEDVVQESFLTALSQLHRLRDDRAFSRWFRQIIRTHACRVLRGRRELSLEDTDPRDPGLREDVRESLFDRMEKEDLHSIVREAMTRLSPQDQQTLELFYEEDASCADMAELLHVPVGTVKRRLHDSRRRLRGMLLGHLDPPAPKVKKRKGLPL